MSDEHDECTESYQDCVRSRQERVRRAVEDNPEGSTRKIADAAGVSYQAVSKHRNKMVNALTTKKMDNRLSTRNLENADLVDEPEEPEANVVKLRRRRPDWRPRQPRRTEISRWIDQFLGWTPEARETAWLLIRDSKGDLPDDAYYTDDGLGSSSRNGSMGRQKTSPARAG